MLSGRRSISVGSVVEDKTQHGVVAAEGVQASAGRLIRQELSEN